MLSSRQAGETKSAVAATRRPGRPRQAELEQRVLAAVVQLIDAGEPLTVSAVVEQSGASRAAIYRRWKTMAELTAAALDVGRVVVEIPETLSVRDALAYGHPQAREDLLTAEARSVQKESYPEARMRRRLQLALADPELQHEYWKSHVSRRRKPLLEMLQRGQRNGEVREDVDLEATLDLLSGIYYYQITARGESLDDLQVAARCAAAADIIWRGIAVDPGGDSDSGQAPHGSKASGQEVRGSEGAS